MKRLFTLIALLSVMLGAAAQTNSLLIWKDGAYTTYMLSSVDSITIIKGHKIPEYAVDLGLPSGTLWADRNVGADSPEDYGDYFAWGETEPKSTYNANTYKWCNGSLMTKYCANSFYGYNGFTDNKTTLELSDDAAYVNMGSSWRMPTEAEFQELEEECTWTWTTQNSVEGYKVTGPNGKSIFLPAAGFCHDSNLSTAGYDGSYWSSTLDGNYPYNSYNLGFYSRNHSLPPANRVYGQSVRAVVNNVPEYAVDLGLPSGTLWADRNVGADSPEDYGSYFAWGETVPKDSSYDWSTYKWCNGDSHELTKYCTKSSYGYNGFTDSRGILEPTDDAATANWGENWCMPTYYQLSELENECSWTWTTQKGVKGYKVTGPNGNSIFLPAAGYYHYSSDLDYAGSAGYCWSSSLSEGNPYGAYGLEFGSNYRELDFSVRNSGCPVRAVVR